MPWPLASHFNTILHEPRVAFRDPRLQACVIERNALNQPRAWSGAFAVVYKGVDPQGKAWALRAFTTECAQRREHYDAISGYLKTRKLQCLVDFEYRDSAIRSAGDGKCYPLVVMDWVEGMTLFAWVQAKCRKGKGTSIAKSVRHWRALVHELAQAGIAHGDLQHANVLVTPQGRLKLVDYDGMCVPTLVGRRNLEIGVRPYQHPQRNESTLLSPGLDHFSALLIYVALRALAADTSLWSRHVEPSGYDRLLFRSEDFEDRERSALYKDLLASPDAGVRELTAQLFAYAQGPMEAVPLLTELVVSEAARAPVAQAGQVVSRPSAVPEPVVSDRPASRVVLDVVAGPLQGTSFVVDKHDTLLLGRGADCGVRITDDPRVSRHHALLEVIPPQARLRDLGSRNGTFVNGARYGGRSSPDDAEETSVGQGSEVDLRHGDQITVGRTVMHLRVESLDVRPKADQSPPSPPAERVEPRQVPVRLIDELELGPEIGSGRLGSVCQAFAKDRRPLAVKIVPPKVEIGRAERQSVLEEMARFQQLRHPHIVGLLEMGTLRRNFYLVLEYCDSGSLEQWRQEQGGKLILGQARPLMLQCLDALEYAHQQGLVHGDLKPQNILLHRQAGKRTARIADFGLARALERTGFSGMTATGQIEFHYQFTPRERLMGFRECPPVSDLWSLAAVFYYVLTGELPKQRSGRDPIAALLHADAVPIRERDPRVPPSVAEVLDRALAADPDQRYRTAAEMKAGLKRAFGLVRGN